jgi:hypothetical protein
MTVYCSPGSSQWIDSRGGRVVVTDAARVAVRRVCRDTGRRPVLLSWPGGAVFASWLDTPAAFDVFIDY